MRNLFFSIATLFAATAFAQEDYFRCGTTEMQNKWFAEHPELKAEFDKRQQEAADWDKEQFKTNYEKNTSNNAQQKTTAASVYTIPVVFHILHQGGTENISDAQVYDAVAILNRDYNKLNADTANVVAAFQNKIGNAKFQFVLATKDPNGNCTNGITRHFDSKTNWSGNSSDYTYTWNRTRYLNVYIVKSMGNGAAGYTYYPGNVGATMDAIVILHNYVGSIGTGNSFRSRALTHEVGHWFNLPHVWGSTNNPGVACGDDGVSDTPVTKGHTSCNLNDATCTSGVIENTQNYMEYAYCSNMFTIGQAARMTNAINNNVNGSARNNLSTANNLSITGVEPAAVCPPGMMIALPSLNVCVGESLTLSTYTFSGSPDTYEWFATNGASIDDVTAAAPTAVFNNVGTSIVSCTVSNANGTATHSIVVNVKNGGADITSSYPESFAMGVMPQNWITYSPNSSKKWEINSETAYDDGNCIVALGETLSPNDIVILESPTYDFKNNPGATFSFRYAYARKNAQNQDKFRVEASKNCGITWQYVWSRNLATAANSSGGTMTEIFYPANEEQWLIYDKLTSNPDFNQFKISDQVRLRFVFEEDGGVGFGNRFYLDAINFSTPSGVNELSKAISLNVYPNPASEETTIGFTLSDAANIKYSVTTITGATVMEVPASQYAQGSHEISVNTSKLSSGIYFINLELNGVKLNRKLVVN